EPSFLQADRLLAGQHSQGAANFHAQRGDSPNHFQDDLEFAALWSFPPGRAHAKSRYTACNSVPRHADYVPRVEQPLALHPGVVMRALRTIRAILRAAARLYGYQLAGLHAIGSMEFAVPGLRPVNQFGQRRRVNRCDFFFLPIVAKLGTRDGLLGRAAQCTVHSGYSPGFECNRISLTSFSYYHCSPLQAISIASNGLTRHWRSVINQGFVRLPRDA